MTREELCLLDAFNYATLRQRQAEDLLEDLLEDSQKPTLPGRLFNRKPGA